MVLTLTDHYDAFVSYGGGSVIMRALMDAFEIAGYVITPVL